MRISPRLNKYERREMHTKKLQQNMGGTGSFIYENNTDADLKLPKATAAGIRTVGPRKRFEGDSYFMSWVGNPMNLLRFIEEVVPKTLPNQILEVSMQSEQKLILDQPECITTQGSIERVVAEPNKLPINDSKKQSSEFLLNEDPLDGVEIIRG